MKNPFKRERANYHVEAPLTPYQKAEQEWDLRIGSARVQAKNWRILAILTTAIALVLLAILGVVLTTRKDRLYIAEVTREGRVVNVAPLLVKYHPTEAQKRFFIAHFIELVRGIPLDPVLAKKNWLAAYDFLGGRAVEQLNNHFRQNNPINLLGKSTVTTQILDIDPISPTTLHVDWSETVVNAEGREESQKNYSGVFTLIVKQPAKQQEMLRNPLGLHIVDFSISAKEKAKG